MDLYNEKINEFTDWVYGTNSLTGGDDTGGKAVSGEKIRELLQERLKTPVYVWRDRNAHLYRIFSSARAQEMWEAAGGENGLYKDLEISNFTAPSEYSVKVNITSSPIAYTREGVEDQDGAKIRYTWETSNDKGDTQDENMYVTYHILENGKGFTTTKIAGNNSVTEDMTSYLSSGTNTIDISFRGMTTGATANKTVVIHVVKLNLTTDLQYYQLWRNLSQLLFGMYAERNIKGPLSFKARRYYYGSNTLEDGAEETMNSSANITAQQENDLNPSADYREYGTSDQINMKAGMHVVLAYGEMIIDTQRFSSNLLYYIIAVAYAAGGERAIDGISLKYSFNNAIDFVGPAEFAIRATQYEPVTFDWGYIRYVGLKSADIDWYLRDVNTSDSEDVTETFINSYSCEANQAAPTFSFTPSTKTEVGRKTYLVAYRNGIEIVAIPIDIAESTLEISETTGIDLRLKLSAFGRLNNSTTVDEWSYGDYSTTFNGVRWNTANGWYNNSLRLQGLASSAVINHNPFYDVDVTEKGLTVEIEFESEYVQSNQDELIRIGGQQSTDPHISIYANKAQLFILGNPIITTNYKSNERVKLAFIVEPSNNVADELKNVIFIVNNGIAERAVGWADYKDTPSVFICNSGNIRIGGVNSGIRVYNLRCYSKAITITNAYNNFVYDSENKHDIFAANNIYSAGEINMALCRNKLDVIVLHGNLNPVLSRGATKKDSNTACDFYRYNINDSSKDFTVTHGRIRKHGQSTLNYPLTSYKLWTWSSVDEVRPTMTVDASNDLQYTKNRYQMKNNSIPSNKFVLQANYADSSGTHNGGFLRLIQDTWFNAKIDGEYKLRTQPQLFTTNLTISPQIWTEGGVQYGDLDMTLEQLRLFSGMNAEGKQWGDYFGDAKFPYTIRVAPDSFPCLVFYQNEDTGDTVPHFLGLYVFMDDKKSDYVYGERSIYKVDDALSGTNNVNDPFCVKMGANGESVWKEKSGSKIWDNNKVLRVECLSANSTLSNFRGYIADNSHRRFDDVILGLTDEDTSIGWEEDFELVYPEKEEITVKVNKVDRFDALKFVQTVQPFTNWLEWLIGTYHNQQKFQDEAAQHLDLYKMAAYYIFVLRFGLVDSLERNAQIKTYDGVHFHYEPWDMDIALGNRNTGGIAFDPPIDRNTNLDENTKAITGRARIDTNDDKVPDTWVSNWLFDALESWDYWMKKIVPDVADALVSAGLTYNNVIKVLDEDYQDAWCESIYNESGLFKYVVNRQNVDDNGNIAEGYNDGWLDWLLGARTTHRHWWLKTSMDYYDAKWGVGEFKNRSMYLACEMHNVNGSIKIMPTGNTYFSFSRESTDFGPYPAQAAQLYEFDVHNINSGAKVPFKIYGANFIKELDISDVADGLQVLSLATAYSPEVGPILTKLNISVPITAESVSHLEASENTKSVTIEAGSTLNAVEEINIRGQKGVRSLGFLSNIRTISKLHAAGSGLNALISATGTEYDTLELPDTLTSIAFNSTTWDPSKLSFWISTPGTVITHTYTLEATDEQGNFIYEEDGVTHVMEEYTVEEVVGAQYDKYTLAGSGVTTAIPRNLTSVVFRGTTGKNACARQFVVDWIDSIIAWGTEDWNNNAEGTEVYETLDEYLESLFRQRTLSVENIYWDNDTIAGLSYQQLQWISMFNNIDYSQQFEHVHPNVTNFARGYVVLTDAEPLTGILTSYLSTWFGDSAFTLNGAGLTIDQQLDYTSIVVGQDSYVVDGLIYLNEGDSARISATKFNLQTTLSLNDFFIAAPGSDIALTSYPYPNVNSPIACAIESNEIGGDYIYYLKTYPNVTGQDYSIDLICGANRVRVNIKAMDYPEEMFLSINGETKEANTGSSSSFYKYFKTPDLFVLGAQTGEALFGVQFKDGGRYVNSPRNSKLSVEYAKFKLYKEGVLCSEFTAAKDYYYFTTGDSKVHTFVDSGSVDLSYITGYKPSSDMYKYYMPVRIETGVTSAPVLYRLDVDIKVGGMIRTLSQNIMVVRDATVATAGTALWGIINHAYVLQFNENYPSDMPFYKSVCKILTGTVSVDGLYKQGATFVNVSDNINTLTTLLSNGRSIFLDLPNITGIKLDGAPIYPTVDNLGTVITNIDLTNITGLTSFSVKNCANLDDSTIDLSAQSNIAHVDVSGTDGNNNTLSINVLLPANTVISNLALGAPTSVVIDSPTVLEYDDISVTDSSNITNVKLTDVNSTTLQGFKMFGQIMGIS